jgi:protein-S-isoprenylcysteine O-methyltransferase Ste14
MVRIGNFFFHYRNGLFPLVYVLIFINGPDAFTDKYLALIVGIVIALLGQILRGVTVGLDYIVRGGHKRQVHAEALVQGGLFAHCRNPLYVGNYLIIVGVGVASNSLLFLTIALPFFFFAYWAIISAEENFLRNKFGQEFDDYCRRVNRVIPNFSGLSKTLEGSRYNWRRLITAEYNSAYLWTMAIVMVCLMDYWYANAQVMQNTEITGLWISAAVLTIVYLTARFLKKTHRLDPVQSET